MSSITETAQSVLEKRYFREGEKSWGQVAERVAAAFARDEEELLKFQEILLNLDFLPNSPALMNAGTAIKAYSACYVLPIEDNIDSIYKFYSDAAKISKSGGGVGANYSKLRAKNSTVQSTQGVASGPLSFMEVQDVSTDIIKQGGRRRGANMGILNCDHPDIWDFIKAKDTPEVLENFNLSVGLTDEFMDKILNPDKYYDTLREQMLWDELIQRAWSSAEPGVLFLDTIERGNLVPHLGKLDSTNPCGEQPLLPYESCTLGSINLSNHVMPIGAIDSDGKRVLAPAVDWQKLRDTVHTATLFLNRILDASEMPIPECQEAMEKTRKIGLGIMGLHDMLIQLGLPYDSQEARDCAEEVMRFIAEEANKASENLTEVEGFYGACLESDNSPPRRNANLTTIAPTGTLSMIADCSSGCEPYYAPMVYKTVLDGTTFAMPNKWAKKLMDEEGVDEFDKLSDVSKSLLKGAGEIAPKDHVLMQAALQKYVDSSISKTINMPNSATIEDVREVFELAYRTGCKGITVYRDGSRDAQVLQTNLDGHDRRVVSLDEQDDASTSPCSKAELPDTLKAIRYRVRVKDHKVYIIVAEDDSGRPMEIFAKFPYESGGSWNTLCRSLSLSMRYGIPLKEIIKQLEKSVASLNDMPSHLARILKMYLQSKGALHLTCKECGGEVVFTEGCEKCTSCGNSKCG